MVVEMSGDYLEGILDAGGEIVGVEVVCTTKVAVAGVAESYGKPASEAGVIADADEVTTAVFRIAEVNVRQLGFGRGVMPTCPNKEVVE